MSDPIPVTIVSGFLGSGKTTMLNRVLSGNHGRRIAVLVNELGEVGLDGSLIDGGENFVELDNGCLCCALNEDLVTTLAEIGKTPGLEHCIIETTGIADPLPIGHAVTRPELMDRFRLDALVTTVDALHLEAALETSEEAAQQIRRADIMLLTKLDLVDEAREKEVRAKLADSNPLGRLLRADDPAALELLIDAGLDDAPKLTQSAGCDDHDHDDHDHDHHDHDTAGANRHGFESVAVQVGDHGTIRFAFEEFLEDIPEAVYRSKGIVKIDGERGRLVFHTVGGRVDLWHEPDRLDDGVLVFIGKGIDTAGLREEVLGLFGMSEA